MQNIWIGADWHLWSATHNNAHPYRTKKNIETLIHNYSTMIEEDDILLMLGDITDPAVTNFEQLQNMIRSIPGTKILCRGNHDIETDDWYYTLGFRHVCEVCTCHQFVFSHKPIIVDKGLINIHADLHFGKVINNGYQHINAYAALHQSDPDAPILLEDLLDTATMSNEDLNDTDHLPPKMTQATMMWTNEKYNNIIDITDMVSLSPMDESSMPVIVSLSADIEKDGDDISLDENVMFSGKDLEYNLDKWKKEKNHNILYVTGLSGSGKSTLAEEYEKKYNAHMFELDGIQYGYDSSNKDLLKRAMEKFPEYKNALINNGSMNISDIIKMIGYIQGLMLDDPDTLYIMEGVQIYFGFIDPKTLINKPLIIKNTSALTSAIRAIKRTSNYNVPTTDMIKKYIPEILSSSIRNYPIFIKFKNHMKTHINEVLFRDVESTKYFESDDDKYSSDINRSKYADSKTIKNVNKNDVAADGESTTMDETAKKRVNDKGEEVPEVCPKCGSKVGVFLRGEPVFLCTNKKCEKYFGTVPFKNESVSWKDHYENHSLIWSTLYPYDADHLKCSLMNYMHEAYGCDQVNIQCYSGKDFRDELGLPRSYTSYGDEDTLVVMETTGLSASVINHIKNDTDARYVTDMIDNHVRIMETALSEYHGPEYINQSNIDIAWKYIYENSLDPSVFVGMILDEMAYEDYCDHYYAELKRIVAKYNKDTSIKKKMAKICEVDEKDIPDFECHIAVSGEKQLAFTILTEDVDETIRINMERYLNAMCKELAKTSKEYPATGTIWTADGDGVIYINLKFDSIVESTLSNYIKDLPAIYNNFRANAMYTGKWDFVQDSFTKLIQNADTMERINYLRRDARYGITSMEKLLDKMEKVQRGEMTNKYVENCMKGGNTPDKLREHVKWLRTKALPMLTERAKEIRSKSKSMNETSSSIPSLYFISTDPSMDDKTLIPRIPNNFLTQRGYEDATIPDGIEHSPLYGDKKDFFYNYDIPKETNTSAEKLDESVKVNDITRIVALNNELNDYQYGLSIDNQKIKKQNTTSEDYDKYYRVATPAQFVKQNGGICWDFATYEAFVFKKQFPNIKFKTYYIVFDAAPHYPTHTFLIFEKDMKFYYFESSFKRIQGIWVANSISDIFNFVLRSMDQYRPKNYKSSLLKYKYAIFEYNALHPDIPGSTTIEFMNLMEEIGQKIPHVSSSKYDVKPYIDTNDFTVRKTKTKNENDPVSSEAVKLDFYLNKEHIAEASISAVDTDKGFLYDLEVFKKYRGQGNGIKVMQYIMANYKVSDLSVDADNIPAIKLYTKFGFKRKKSFYDKTQKKTFDWYQREPILLDESVNIQDSYHFELLDKNVHFYDKIDEAATDNKKLYPVYVVLVHSGTIISRAIKAVSHSEFSHASISFDSSLKKMYSFARKDPSNFLIGGFRYETIGEGFYKNKEIPYAVYCVPCTKSQIDAMKKRLNYFIRNESKFTFDFAGLVKNYLGIVDNPEYSWFCSRFVADILNAGAPSGKLYVNEPSLQDPDDFMQMEEAIYVTGGMNLMKYDKSLADKRTKVILTMAQRGKINRDRYRNEPITESATKRIGKRGIPTYEKPAGMVAYDMSHDEAEQIAQKYGIHTSRSKDDHTEFSDKYEDPEKKKERLKEEKRLALERARRQKKKLERRKKLKSKLPWVKNETFYMNLHEADTSVDDSDNAHYDTDNIENDDLRGRRKEVFPNREMPQEDIDKPIITPKNESFRFLSKMTESDINTENGHDPTAIYVMFGTDGIRISFTPDLTQYYQIKHTHDDIYRIEHRFRNMKDTETGKIVALSYEKSIIDIVESKLNSLSGTNTPIRFAVPITKMDPSIASRLITDIFQIGQINTDSIKPITESIYDYTGIDDSIHLKRNMKILRGYAIMESTVGMYDMDQDDPYLNETMDHIFACIDENAIGSIVNYLKSFKLHFDQDGNIIIHRREYDKLRMHFNTSLRMIRASEKAGNVTGVKDELTRIHYMIQIIDQYFISTPTSNRSTLKAKDMIDLRSVMINVFSQHLKWVTLREPDFNFNNYYEGTVYSKSITIPHSVIHALGKTFITLLA